MLVQILVGLVMSGAIAAVAWRRRSLSADGAMAAVGVGTLIFGFGGFAWGFLLVLFFVTSSALSRFKADRKAAAQALGAKGDCRDARQVLENGAIATLAAVAFGLTSNPLCFAAFLGAIATATADTWATEIGGLARHPPRLITNGRIVPPGTSGAISLPGSLAAIAGASLIGAFASIFAGFYALGTEVVAAAVVGGVAGAFFDSFLGATAQAVYHCDACGTITEAATHRCGRPARLVKGIRILDNGAVNLLATIVGAAIAVMIAVGWRSAI